MSTKKPTDETPTEEESTWGKETPETPPTPSKTEAPLFKLLGEIRDAVLAKEAQTAHHLDKQNQILEKLLPVLESLAKGLPVTTPTPTPATAPKTPETPPKTTPAPTPPTPSAIDKVKGYFPKDLLELLKFEDLGDYIKVAPRQYLGSENFAKIASIVRDNGGEYISAGKDSHFRVQK